MTKARDYTKTESGIQLMKQLGGGRGATKKGLIKNLKKLFFKQKTVKSQESLTRAGKDLKLKKAGVLKVQKPDKSPKSSDWDARLYNQPRKHGTPMGPRAVRDLEKKHPKTTMNKRIKAGTITNKPKPTSNKWGKGPWPKYHSNKDQT